MNDHCESRWRDDEYEYNREWASAGHYLAIRARLATLGLLETEADKQLESVINTVASLSAFIKGHRKHYKPERIKTSFLKSYRLTTFGDRFLSFFCCTDKN